MFISIWLTLKLSFLSSFFLLFFGIFFIIFLNLLKYTFLRISLEIIIFLPLVLPPTILGFYLLLFFKYISYFFSFNLCFTFFGLFIGSIFYSLPFAIQPLYNSFILINEIYFKSALVLKSSKCDYFFFIHLPLMKRFIFIAFIFTFSHTLGEFGIALMIGGNISYETQVISIKIFEYVEMLEYTSAHILSFCIIVVSFFILYCLFKLNYYK